MPAYGDAVPGTWPGIPPVFFNALPHALGRPWFNDPSPPAPVCQRSVVTD